MSPSTANDQKSGSVERSTSNNSHNCSVASRLAHNHRLRTSVTPSCVESDLIDDLNLKFIVEHKDTAAEDHEARVALDRAIEEWEDPQKDPSSPRSRPTSPTSGGPAPDWLGKPGFDVQTAARLERADPDYLSDYPFPPPILTDDEEKNDEELAALKGRTIEYSKSMVLKWLDWYDDIVENGSLEVEENLKRVLRRIIKEAKGKKPQLGSYEEIHFVSWLQFERRFNHVIKSPEDSLRIWFWRYSRQCLATGTDIDEDVISKARRILSMAEEETGQEVSKGSNAFKT